MIGLLKGMIEEPGIKDFLGTIEVSIAESWMTIAFDLDLADIDELMEKFEL